MSIKFHVRYWCNDCLDDEYGCFNGYVQHLTKGDLKPFEEHPDEVALFDTYEEAKQAGSEKTEDCSIWDYAVYLESEDSGTLITTDGIDRQYKLCVCSKCDYVAMCTPDNDFYVRSGDPGGPLFCRTCIYEVARRAGSFDSIPQPSR